VLLCVCEVVERERECSRTESKKIRESGEEKYTVTMEVVVVCENYIPWSGFLRR